MARSNNGNSSNFAKALVPYMTGVAGNPGPWTVSFWWKPNTTSDSSQWIHQARDLGTGNQCTAFLWCFTGSGQVSFNPSGYTGAFVPSTNSQIQISDTNWHHFAYRKNGSSASAWDKFLDGNRTSITTAAAFTLAAGDGTGKATSTLFGGVDAGGTPTLVANGAIYDFSIWENVSVSDSDILAMANGTKTASTIGGYGTSSGDYFMNATSGTATSNVTDISGGSNNLTTGGSLPFVAGPVFGSGGTAVPKIVNFYSQMRG